jgi:hypothetical protein
MRKHSSEYGVNHQLRLAARACHLQIVRFLLSHIRILRHFACNGHRRAAMETSAQKRGARDFVPLTAKR